MEILLFQVSLDQTVSGRSLNRKGPQSQSKLILSLGIHDEVTVDWLAPPERCRYLRLEANQSISKVETEDSYHKLSRLDYKIHYWIIDG